MTWWETDTWHRYEELCGDEPGTRTRLLASAEFNTRVVDLSVSEAELWRAVRRSYHALIHKAEREYFIGQPPAGEVALHRALHHHCAGHETRPGTTWNMMEDWLNQGSGVLVSGWKREPWHLVGYVHVVVYGAWAYYFSAASLEKNLNHALLWHAMKVLKARGVRYFELGWMARESDTPKDVGISHFKVGMGGYDMLAKEAPELCGQCV